MRGLRFLQLSAVLFTLAAAGQAHAIASLELEAGGGLNLKGPKSPLLSARVGLDLLSSFTISLRGQFALGHDYEGCGGTGTVNPACSAAAGSGYKSWALFPELRLRAPIPFVQPDLAIGVGLANLTSYADHTSFVDKTDGSKLYAQFGIGLRINIPTTSFYLRPEASASMYTGVTGPDADKLFIYNLQLLIGWSAGF